MSISATVRFVDSLAILKASRRFDLIFKVMLAKAWAAGDPTKIREAEEAYLEMVRSRNGFFEHDPYRDKPEDFIEAFHATERSIRENGYDVSKGAIPVDANMELLNGAHRLCACVACSRPCPVVESDVYPAGGSVLNTFLKGHIHPSVLQWGARKYISFIPDGAIAAQLAPYAAAPAIPFPDWTKRNRQAWLLKIKPALVWLAYALALPFKKRGPRRDKQRRRLLRERKKITGYSALARYWTEKDRCL